MVAEYGLNEATKGITKLDLREQELKDMEVARKLQEEELKVREENLDWRYTFKTLDLLDAEIRCTLD